MGNYRHGKANSPEDRAYHNARSRCTNPKNPRFYCYGARGIEFRFTCLQELLEDIGERPSPEHTLDRKNNDGHYEPGNVRWATRSEQAKNRNPFTQPPRSEAAKQNISAGVKAWWTKRRAA
jgi:hypothetical protein